MEGGIWQQISCRTTEETVWASSWPEPAVVMKAQVCQWGRQTSEVKPAGRARILEWRKMNTFSGGGALLQGILYIRSALHAGGLR